MALPKLNLYKTGNIIIGIMAIATLILIGFYAAPTLLNWGIEKSVPQFTSGYDIKYNQYIMTGYLMSVSEKDAWLVVGPYSYLIDLKNQSEKKDYKICKHDTLAQDKAYYDYSPIKYAVYVIGEPYTYKYILRRELC